MRFWIGSYPLEDGVVPPAEGVWRVDLDDDGTLVDRGRAAALEQASFLARHPREPVLYATQELEPGGAVAAFAVGDLDQTDAALRGLGATSSDGGYPCHLEVLDAELLVSCYGSAAPGSAVLASLPLAADGSLEGAVRVHAHAGPTGPRGDRQESSHVHSATSTPDGRHAWAADLGTDQLVRYRVAPDGVVPDGVTMRMPAGSGPRHLIVLPGGVAIVVCELDSTVAVVRLPDDASPGAVLQVLPACGTAAGDGPSQPSHLALNAAGTRLHVGVRGQDVIATFAVVGLGGSAGFEDVDSSVRLRHLGDTPCGSWPRHHAVLAPVRAADRAEEGAVGKDADVVVVAARGSAEEGAVDEDADVVVVAAQGSAELVALEIGADGVGRVLSRLAMPVRPSCVVPV